MLKESKKMLMSLAMSVFIVTTSSAMDASIDGSKSQKTDQDDSMQRKKSFDKKESWGDRSLRSDSVGGDKTESQALKAIEQAMKSNSIDMSISLDALFLQSITALETEGKEPFASCRIATKPRLPADFGLTAQISPNVIDSIKAEWLSKAAASNARLEGDTEAKVLEYRDCMAYYGAVVAQAYLYLGSDLKEIGAQVMREKFKGREFLRIKDLSLDDFTLLAKSTFRKAVDDISSGKGSQSIRRTFKMATSPVPCQFNGMVEKVNCGGSTITIAAPPHLVYAGLNVYGAGGYMGFKGDYKITSNYSFSNALEDLQSVSKFEKWVKEVSSFSENLRSKGYGKEAVYVEKKAWELAKLGKVGVSPAKLMPGVN